MGCNMSKEARSADNEDPSHTKLRRPLSEMNGLDYGSCMAHSYFYGYLSMVLPNIGDTNNGLSERIDDYMSKLGLQKHQFPVKKLLVLIPSSAFIPPKLHYNAPQGSMLTAESLEEQQFNVAGVRNRSYKNSIYKIRIAKGKKGKHDFIYVVAEGATPLRTLHHVVHSGGNSVYSEYQNDIIHMFVQTLRQLIQEDVRVQNLCELIYYVDKDQRGDYVNVAEVILQHINKL